MPTTSQFLMAIVDVTGASEPLLRKVCVEMRHAGMLPPESRGGGRNTHDIEAPHAAYILLALTAGGPAIAVEVIRALAEIAWDRPQAGDFTTLHGELTGLIQRLANAILRGEITNR